MSILMLNMSKTSFVSRLSKIKNSPQKIPAIPRNIKYI